jgi:hypothetical protein
VIYGQADKISQIGFIFFGLGRKEHQSAVPDHAMFSLGTVITASRRRMS